MLASYRKHLLITLTLSISVLVAVIAIGMHLGINMVHLTNDGSFISDIGVILWCVTASVCSFAALLLRNNQEKDVHRFLLYSGLLTTYFLLDDFFQIHDHYLHNQLGINEKIVYMLMGIAAFTLVIKFRQTILRTNYIVMLTGLWFLAISVASDGIIEPLELIYGILVLVVASSFYIFTSYRSLFKEFIMLFAVVIALAMAFIVLVSEVEYSEYIFEEGAKWLGISSWCSYYVHTAYQFVVNANTEGNTSQQAI